MPIRYEHRVNPFISGLTYFMGGRGAGERENAQMQQQWDMQTRQIAAAQNQQTFAGLMSIAQTQLQHQNRVDLANLGLEQTFARMDYGQQLATQTWFQDRTDIPYAALPKIAAEWKNPDGSIGTSIPEAMQGIIQQKQQQIEAIELQKAGLEWAYPPDLDITLAGLGEEEQMLDGALQSGDITPTEHRIAMSEIGQKRQQAQKKILRRIESRPASFQEAFGKTIVSGASVGLPSNVWASQNRYGEWKAYTVGDATTSQPRRASDMTFGEWGLARQQATGVPPTREEYDQAVEEEARSRWVQGPDGSWGIMQKDGNIDIIKQPPAAQISSADWIKVYESVRASAVEGQEQLSDDAAIERTNKIVRAMMESRSAKVGEPEDRLSEKIEGPVIFVEPGMTKAQIESAPDNAIFMIRYKGKIREATYDRETGLFTLKD